MFITFQDMAVGKFRDSVIKSIPGSGKNSKNLFPVGKSLRKLVKNFEIDRWTKSRKLGAI